MESWCGSRARSAEGVRIGINEVEEEGEGRLLLLEPQSFWWVAGFIPVWRIVGMVAG